MSTGGHPVCRLILGALVVKPKGYELNARQAPAILEMMAEHAERGDGSATTAFYETVGMLLATNGAPAARELLRLATQDTASRAKPRRSTWASRK